MGGGTVLIKTLLFFILGLFNLENLLESIDYLILILSVQYTAFWLYTGCVTTLGHNCRR